MTVSRCVWIVAVSFLVSSLVPASAWAQGTATMAGVVRDQQTLVVPGATVTVAGTENTLSRTLTTGADGTFEFAGLQPGEYSITVELAGFSKDERKVQLEVNQRVRVDVVLKTGTLSQDVQVSST